MSIQFGKCNLDGKPVDPKDLDQVRPMLAAYGPDGEGCICRDNFGILYRAFHTTKESRNEVQPCVSASGAVITWDGRLDNREDIIGQLHGDIAPASTDVDIVAAAYDQHGIGSLARLIGDWALSIWNPKDQSIILANDLVGTRHLYYSIENDQVTWCTILDPLVLFAGHSFRLEEEYIAGWLSSFPAPHLTPYVGIHSVPPSCFVRMGKGTHSVNKHWDFDPAKRIRYRDDAEYEDHFRVVFAQSVRRRLRSDHPVLAELSGGMDSSSIVCMGDALLSDGMAETPRLDTISYYDDSEPGWNERPYFSKVEEKRGKTGCHIDASSHELFLVGDWQFLATPASGSHTAGPTRMFEECMLARGSRTVLSGTGGDEVMGGVPTPIPELEDLLASARFGRLAHRLKLWSLDKRVPWFHLLAETIGAFLPPGWTRARTHRQPAPWLNQSFANRNRVVLQGYDGRSKLFGPLPSLQENLSALNALQRQFGCEPARKGTLYEKRYPYLDRDLMEFIYAIPREQIVRPGQRRSLMRRSLAGLVPEEILNRKRKAFVVRAHIDAISKQWAGVMEICDEMASSSLNIVDANRFREALQLGLHDPHFPVVSVLRTLNIELWLRNIREHGIANGFASCDPEGGMSPHLEEHPHELISATKVG
jgi:asparagine synthase (glutamine-hydrolysing)